MKYEELNKHIEGFLFSGKDPFLIAKELTEYILNNYELKKNDSLIKEEVLGWIDSWLKLFPRGIKSGGKLLRSDAKGCLKKMITFRKDYPEYTPDIILKATEKYLKERAEEGYSYAKCATYFIHKEKEGSELAGLCSEIIDVGDVGETLTPQVNNFWD